jgi:formate dehydrogenase major subunit
MVNAAITPPGGAKTDFEILTTVSKALGHDMGFETPEDVMAEIAELTPDLAGVTYDRIGRQGLCWPVAQDGTDSPILYATEFHHPNGLARLAALPYKPPGTEASDEFPLILVTGRRLEHYNAGTMTRRTGNLELLDREWMEVHPDDAARLWINEGDIVSVRSPVGRIEVEARITDKIEPGHVFTAFHFPEVRTNELIGQSRDVNTSCPEYKVVAVDVRPMSETPAERPVLASAL